MKKTLIQLSLVLIIILSDVTAQDSIPVYSKTTHGFVMVLREGDNVLEKITWIANREKIPSANYTGMGFVNATFGFFNAKTKKYKPREFSKVELAGMSGSIAWQNDTVSLHTHGIVTGKNFKAFGGHLLAATVSTGSVEIFITVNDKRLERKIEEPLGANVLQLRN